MLNMFIFTEILRATPKPMAYKFIMMAAIPLHLEKLTSPKVLYLECKFFFLTSGT